jgi:hypothetical protein
MPAYAAVWPDKRYIQASVKQADMTDIKKIDFVFWLARS